MAQTITGEQILAAVIQRSRIGQVIPSAQIGSLAAGSVTSVLRLRNGLDGPNTYRDLGGGIYRPGNATGAADYFRACGTLTPSTGVLAVDANWADTTLGSETLYLLYYRVHPQDLLDALEAALRETYFENMEPLSMKPSGTTAIDSGFQSTATTAYVESDADGGAATTFSKVTTANSENVFYGIGAGRVLNAAAGGYIRQRFNVTEQEQYIVHALSRLDAGTNAELVLRDSSNSAFIGTTVEHDQEAYQWMRRVETIPTDCKILEVRLQGEGETDDVYWNGLCVLSPNHPYVVLDTKWDSRTELKLMYADLGSAGPTNGTYPAASARLREIPSDDYAFRMERPGANPYAVQFHHDSQKHWFKYPIYIQGRRAYSDLTTFTLALSETTSADLDTIEARMRVEMFNPSGTCRHVPDREALYAAAQDDLALASAGHRIEGPQERQHRVGMFKVPS